MKAMRSSTFSQVRLVFVVVGLLIGGVQPVVFASSSRTVSTTAMAAPGNDQGTKGTGSAG
jgi:hypothetical protein